MGVTWQPGRLLAKQRSTDNYLARLERLAILGAVAFSPFRFLNLAGANFGPTDILLMVAFVGYVWRTRRLPLAPSRLTAIGIGAFLLSGALGVFITPRPIAALLDYLQYVYLFLVVVPIAVVAFFDAQTRRSALFVLGGVLNSLLIITFVIGLFEGAAFSHLTLGYGNPNQLYWHIASAFAVNVAVALDEKFPQLWRRLGSLFAVLALVPIALGMSFTSMMLVGAVSWLALAWYITFNRQRRARYGRLFVLVSSAAIFVAGMVLAISWDVIVQFPPVHSRRLQYTAAWNAALNAFPLGTGLASGPVILSKLPDSISRSVHNVIFAYFMQMGLIGAGGFGLILFEWMRRVFIPFYLGRRIQEHADAFEFIPIGVFGTYFVIMMLQPVPVQRYWWLVFSLSWGAVLSEPRTLDYETYTRLNQRSESR